MPKISFVCSGSSQTPTPARKEERKVPITGYLEVIRLIAIVRIAYSLQIQQLCQSIR
jgi:hypothetical protein